MKHRLPTSALVTILVFSAGFLFPLIFTITDQLLRTFLQGLEPVVLTVASFIWLLVLYFYGIKFSLEYVTRQFEIPDRQKLFSYSLIAFTSVSLLFYATLVSSSVLSNIIWGLFYLITIFFFYFLGKTTLLEQNTSD